MIKHLCIGLASVLSAYTIGIKFGVSDHKYFVLLFAVSYAVLFIATKYLERTKYRNLIDNASDASTKLSLKEKLFALSASVISLTLMSTSSPLYPFNIWNDANQFFTVGRGIKAGLIPYRDMYEQKGPVLYLAHALCALISDKSFTGVWILEIIMCFIFTVFALKIVKLFIKDTSKYHSVFVILPVCALIYSSSTFHLGDSCEELCFPLLTVVLYITLKALRKDKQLPSAVETFVIGLICGIVFWTKYNLCGLIIGAVLFFLIYSIIDKQFKKLLYAALLFLAGFMAVTIPVLIYFALNNALTDLFTVYFYNNIFLYSGVTATQVSLIRRSFYGFGLVYRYTYGMLIIVITAIVSFSFLNKRSALFLLCTFVLMIFSSMGGNYVIFYYGFIFMAFSAIFMITLTSLYVDIVRALAKQGRNTIVPALIVCILTSALLFSTSKKRELMLKPYDELPQAIFAQKINETPNARILTYDFMDNGFFTAAGLLPANRFYTYLNIEDELPELRESQEELIEEEYFDYIITNNQYEWDNYCIIIQSEYSIPYVDGNSYNYLFYLYGRTR